MSSALSLSTLRLLLALPMVLGAGLATADDSTPGEALAVAEEIYDPGDGARVTGWYVAPSSGFTRVNGDLGYLVGMRAVVMLNGQAGIGVAGNALATGSTRLGGGNSHDLGAYGGIYLQYQVGAGRRLHLYGDATLGPGVWCFEGAEPGCRTRDFVMVEPTLNAELNVAPNVKLAVGAGYRAAFAAKGPGPSAGALSGLVGRASLVLGMF
jgi:hypothetical protein